MQEVKWALSTKKCEENYINTLIMKLLKTKDKGKSPKSSQKKKKWHIVYRQTKIRKTADFSLEKKSVKQYF